MKLTSSLIKPQRQIRCTFLRQAFNVINDHLLGQFGSAGVLYFLQPSHAMGHNLMRARRWRGNVEADGCHSWGVRTVAGPLVFHSLPHPFNKTGPSVCFASSLNFHFTLFHRGQKKTSMAWQGTSISPLRWWMKPKTSAALWFTVHYR